MRASPDTFSQEFRKPFFGLRQKFALFLSVAGVVLLLSVLKGGIHWQGLEFISLNTLLTSGIGGALFILGFLLSGVLSDYKEADRLPAEIRVALEGINGDVAAFEALNPSFDGQACREILIDIVHRLRQGLGREAGYMDLVPALEAIDRLSAVYLTLERLGCPNNYVVRLRTLQDSLRRSIVRIYHIQRVQFVPSVHVLAQTLVAFIILLLLFLKTEGSPESMLMFGFISFLFVYALYLIQVLEQPFRKGHATLDDVSLFLTTDFARKLEQSGYAPATVPET
ncbi:MAG: hypothetical protein LCH39_01520 [Proteobacteria bacterium]|nr:hypothetical protein [Pseudomonadota bacterium]